MLIILARFFMFIVSAFGIFIAAKWLAADFKPDKTKDATKSALNDVPDAKIFNENHLNKLAKIALIAVICKDALILVISAAIMYHANFSYDNFSFIISIVLFGYLILAMINQKNKHK